MDFCVAENKCTYCGKCFHRRQYLEDHIALRHEGIVKYLCHICAEDFRSCTSYCRHMNMKHPELGNSWKKRKRLPRSRIVGIGEGGEKHVCTICNDIFGSAQELKRHVGIHNKQHKCETCGKTYSSKGSLNNHLLLHTDLRPYPCRFCDKTFRSEANRYQHENIHKGSRKYTCPICNQSYSAQSTLRNHLYKYKIHGNVPFPEQELAKQIAEKKIVIETDKQ